MSKHCEICDDPSLCDEEGFCIAFEGDTQCQECGYSVSNCLCTKFADPGGNSALRAASKSNPRNLPCPTCGSPNRLTPEDVSLGYQCNSCADRLEMGYDLY